MNNDPTIISVFYIVDELVKSIGVKDNKRSINTISEIATTAIIAAIYYQGNHRFARLQMQSLGYFKRVASPSRFNRRLNRIPCDFWEKLFSIISVLNKQSSNSKIFIVDSFPVATSQINKFFRAKRFQGKLFHGKVASKKQFFMGIKVHMLTSEKGAPVSYEILPGSCSDLKGLYYLDLELPKSSIILGDKAYSSETMEKYLLESQAIFLLARRKKNQKQQHIRIVDTVISKIRNRIETTFSSITRLFPRSIVARTAEGFMRKVHLFILGYSLKRLLCN